MSPQSHDLLTRLLKQVSRSFYLTLRVLPGAIRPPIGLAYLLARATDTVADTEIVSVEQRLNALRALREAIGRTRSDSGTAPRDLEPGRDGFHSVPIIPSKKGDRVESVPAGLEGRHMRRTALAGGAPEFAPLGELAQHQGLPAERELLERIDDALVLLAELSSDDQRLVREVLSTITSGQELDLQRFGHASMKNVVSLATASELDDYTYRVAGCVGEFWTKMCRAHLFASAPVDESLLMSNGVRFGKGLQLVNILRDLPRDLWQGRCYLPADELASAGLAPRELLEPGNEPRLRPLYDRYLDLAHAHLAAGWDYTNALPGGGARVRLACAWPILIGVKTLGRLRQRNILDPAQRIKITRAEVRGLMWGTLIRLPFPKAWRRHFASIGGIEVN